MNCVRIDQHRGFHTGRAASTCCSMGVKFDMTPNGEHKKTTTVQSIPGLASKF